MILEFCVYVVVIYVFKVSLLVVFCVTCIFGIRVFQDYSDLKLFVVDRKRRKDEKWEIYIIVNLSQFYCWKNVGKN